jgi:hypothetical protein
MRRSEADDGLATTCKGCTAMANKLLTYLANDTNFSTLSPATNPREVMALPRWFTKAKPKAAAIPDYTNQLDLFSEAPIDVPAPVEPVVTAGEQHARPRPPQQLDFGALELLPEDAPAATAAVAVSGCQVELEAAYMFASDAGGRND